MQTVGSAKGSGRGLSPKRSFRLRMQLYVIANYLVDTAMLAMFAWNGTVDWHAPVTYGLLACLLGIAFYVLMARGVTEAMPDPLVDRVQRVCAWTLQLAFIWAYPHLAFLFLNVLFVIFGFSFHQPRIAWRQLVLEWFVLFVATGYLVHQLGPALAPPMGTGPERLLVWLSYVLTLARSAYLGLMGSQLSARLRVANRNIRELNERLDARVDERTRELQRSNDNLSQVNHQLQAFARSLAHDVRQPLITIGGHASLLRERLSSAGAGPNVHLERIARSVRQMDQMCNRLTLLLNVNSMVLDPQEFDLTQLAGEVAHEVEQRYPGRAVRLQVDAGMRLRADRRLVKVALDVLIDNSWKFAADGRTAHVHVACERKQDLDRVSVSDDGPGFNVPYGADQSGQAPGLRELYEESGTGLGLAIVDTVARRHGAGTFACASELGGACVGFTIAAGQPDAV
jgi:signal transduction histidine kinase